MTIDEFNTQLKKRICKSPIIDLDSVGDFQCEQTLGFPAFLNIHWNSGTAWLSLNEHLIDENTDITEYEQACIDWGIRDCNSIEEFNSLLKSLGKEAYEYALPIEETMELSM